MLLTSLDIALILLSIIPVGRGSEFHSSLLSSVRINGVLKSSLGTLLPNNNVLLKMVDTAIKLLLSLITFHLLVDSSSLKIKYTPKAYNLPLYETI